MQSKLVYTALGDSLTLGVGAYFSSGFVQRYAKLIEDRFKVPVITNVFAKPRIPSMELLHMLTNHTVRHSIKQANIITISIGGNDLLQANKRYKKTKNPYLFEEAEYYFYRNIREILFEIQYIKECISHCPYVIQLIGLYNPMPKLSYSDYWINRFNQILYAQTSSTVQYIDLHYIFTHYNHRVLPIGIHPNGKGYGIIANELGRKLPNLQLL
ncbi:MAG: GDSL-type esterase/lipase family protein [Bacillus sp. (in: Bacteria)]|nr:GDSL-type esterase/lipase family protein [Bacillus sp. (in: firmicutes)]